MKHARRLLLATLLAFGAVATAVPQQPQEATPKAVQTPDLVTVLSKAEGTDKTATFKTFVSLVDKAGLTPTLKEPGPYTILAPTDAAFEKVPKELLDKASADPDLLKKVLSYHVIKGNVASTDLKDGTESDTLAGEKLKIAVADPVEGETAKTITFNDKKAKVSKADIKASNGVVHAIDTVLIPPSLEKTDGR